MRANNELRTGLAEYRARWPEESACVDSFASLLGAENPFVRESSPAHFTGSAWLVSADGARVLLTHHRKLDLWLQPGGHADGDRDLRRVALREAREETGLRGLRIESDIFDIDRHRIPARPNEPEHWHYDVRYVVCADVDERYVVSEESHALAWRPIAEVAADVDADASVRRMAKKWLMRIGDAGAEMVASKLAPAKPLL